MKVLAKCPENLRSSMVFFPVNKSQTEILNSFVISSFKYYSEGFVSVRSCFNLSETARLKNIDNNFSDSRQLINCLSVISTFNRMLFFMLNSGEIEASQISCLEVTSAFRSPYLNKYVGGSSTSLHLHGLAIDLYSLDTCAILSISNHIKKIIETYDPCTNCLFPYELISYSPNRIHIGYKWYEKK